uniref:hypothetical protein n=1 Tax=Klebsiella pneumoniae TaxID=573 RepID=UPI001953F199
PATRKEQMARLKRAAKKAPLALSAASGEGVDEALMALLKVIDAARAAEPKPVKPDEAVEPVETGWRP